MAKTASMMRRCCDGCRSNGDSNSATADDHSAAGQQQQPEQRQPEQQQVNLTNQGPVASLDATVDNSQSLTLEKVTRHIVVLVNWMLGEMTLKEGIFESALEGIEDRIIKHWVQNGVSRAYNDGLKDRFCDLLRWMVRFQNDLLRVKHHAIAFAGVGHLHQLALNHVSPVLVRCA